MTPANPRAEERSAVDAASGAADKRRYVKAMFADIAPRYDFLNHVLSFNIDRLWRTRAIAQLAWQSDATGTYLDLCAGTLDVAVELAGRAGFSGRVIGADFVEAMLRAGSKKARGTSVDAVTADALALPLKTASVAGAIVAFGIRNVADLDAGLREVARVVKPGGKFVILEFTRPPNPFVRVPYEFYSNRVLPFIGGLVSGNRGAYRYLPESIARFPSAPELANQMARAGFRDVHYELITFGTVAIHVGTRS